MKVNFGEDRIANTETDELLREFVGGSGSIVRVYKSSTGRFYTHTVPNSSFSQPSIGFIDQWRAEKMIRS